MSSEMWEFRQTNGRVHSIKTSMLGFTQKFNTGFFKIYLSLFDVTYRILVIELLACNTHCRCCINTIIEFCYQPSFILICFNVFMTKSYLTYQGKVRDYIPCNLKLCSWWIWLTVYCSSHNDKAEEHHKYNG